MRFVVSALLLGCGSDPAALPADPARERDVIAAVPRGLGSVIYREPETAWRLADKLDDLRYGFDLAGERYAVAIACVDDQHQTVDVVFSTLAEQVDHIFTPPCGSPPEPEPIRLSGTIRTNAGEFRVNAGDLGIGGFGEGEYELFVPPGLRTIVYTAFDDTSRELLYVIQRDVALVEDRVIDVDFVAGFPVRSNPLQSQVGTPSARFVTGDGTSIPLSVTSSGIEASLVLASPPAAAWRAGDHLALEQFDSNGVAFEAATTRVLEPDEIPGQLGPLRPFAGADVFRTSDRIVGQWYDPSATTYAARLQPQIPPQICGDNNNNGFCQALWTVQVSPGSRDDIGPDLVIVPSEEELAALGIWDERLSLTQAIVWTAGSKTIEGGVEFEGGTSGTIE